MIWRAEFRKQFDSPQLLMKPMISVGSLVRLNLDLESRVLYFSDIVYWGIWVLRT